MFTLYYVGVVIASFLMIESFEDTLKTASDIVDNVDDKEDEKIFTFILICVMAVSIISSWFIVIPTVFNKK